MTITTDTTPPQLERTRDYPSVNDNQLSLSFHDENNLDADPARKPASEDFTVYVDGVRSTVNNVVVGGKLIMLGLSTYVQFGQRVTLAYNDSTPDDDKGIRDTQDNSLASIPTTEIKNNSRDRTPPQLITTGDARPKVSGKQLLLSFSDASNLNTDLDRKPVAGDFAVLVGSSPNAVTEVTVDAQAKTIALTLTTAVTPGQTVTVAYNDSTPDTDGNGIQDAAYNPLVSFPVTDVNTNTVPPQLITTGATRPKANGQQLVLSFDDTDPLNADPTRKPVAGDFTVLAGTTANAVTAVAVDAQAKTITLTLSTTVTPGQAMTVAYTDSTPGDTSAIQDAASNRLTRFAATDVNTADTVPPQLITTGDARPKVSGQQLLLSFDDASSLNADPTRKPVASDFTVLAGTTANTVTAVAVDAQAKTITLTLSTTVTPGQALTVAYTDSTPGDTSAIQDAAGNHLTRFAATDVNTADTTPPQLIATGTPRPKADGQQLVLSFDDVSPLNADPARKPLAADFTVLAGTTANAVTAVAVDAQAKTITLTLSTAVTPGQAMTVAYTDSTPSATDTSAIQDAAGNRLASFAATEINTADTVPPQLITTGTAGPRVLGSDLVLEFSDASNLDAAEARKPLSGDFTVLVDGTANVVTSVVVGANSKLVYLTLSTPVRHGQSVRIAYTDGTPDDTSAIRDTAGNRLTSFPSTAVDNRVPDRESPQLITTGATRPKVNGSQLVLSFGDASNLDADPAHKPATGAFTVLVDGVANAVTAVAVNATEKTVTLTLSTAVTRDQSVSVAYNDPTSGDDANAIQDAAHNDAASFAATTVDNLTPAPPARTPPRAPDADSDSDGISSAQEDQAVGPKGSTTGDGNNDGIQDSAQAAVASFSAKTSSSSGTSVTLVADSQDGKVPSGSHTRITSLEQKAVPAQTPKALETPIALTSFQAALNTVGSSETFSLYVDPKIGANGYWVQDNTGTWVNLASSPYGGKMVNEGGRLRLDFQIKDGGPFDADGEANGVITAPGAAAQMPLSIVGQAPDVAHDGFWF
ncbi:hypothetical protein D5041_11880 [Verminephrobacter aporrectodeae subsp. tuberculatae]|uniref:Ig-like domain (Group 3) n=1 Tax=Verminephrobacter aporrectodeae subsp. tuberculatae TaxID=1110392 RepID=A0ABT3KR84_9BURK|nr:SwmB domain-containing protein [Verminephrobacter aporrectodeae]MCW5220420.1 hypothetical protein [Verminephrobacter aporrectodeae subsp. tuberculatae]MCW5255625.1 hypothetical protein [Verminephrobacter aporrectodeae subsp. tuberculatae]MCW5289716.1 hypothetical protein [Verminephrobacter aporrectodeae subsp. tuberculatae]MCW5320647.1 hypothetical protein [Verminephrobacter aporrectodeae subsp. tuberculatae]